MELKFCARILQNENMDAAYVEVPYDIKELFGKGVPNVAESLRKKGKVITAVKSQSRLMNIS